MKKIKETILTGLMIFCIGGILGLIYGVFSGTYSYYEGIILTKMMLIMFLGGGLLLMLILATVAMLTFAIEVVFRFLREKLFK